VEHFFIWGKEMTDFLIENGVLKKYSGNSTVVYIPNNVYKIDDCAFYHVPTITEITIPDSVSVINGCAFCWCENLLYIKIGANVRVIDHYAISGSKSIAFGGGGCGRKVLRIVSLL